MKLKRDILHPWFDCLQHQPLWTGSIRHAMKTQTIQSKRGKMLKLTCCAASWTESVQLHSQTITQRSSKTLSGKFMSICLQTLDQNVSLLIRRGHKLHWHILLLHQAMKPWCPHRQMTSSSLAGRQLLGELNNSRVVAVRDVRGLVKNHLHQLSLKTQCKSTSPNRRNQVGFSARKSYERLSLRLPRDQVRIAWWL